MPEPFISVLITEASKFCQTPVHLHVCKFCQTPVHLHVCKFCQTPVHLHVCKFCQTPVHLHVSKFCQTPVHLHVCKFTVRSAETRGLFGKRVPGNGWPFGLQGWSQFCGEERHPPGTEPLTVIPPTRCSTYWSIYYIGCSSQWFFSPPRNIYIHTVIHCSWFRNCLVPQNVVCVGLVLRINSYFLLQQN